LRTRPPLFYQLRCGQLQTRYHLIQVYILLSFEIYQVQNGRQWLYLPLGPSSQSWLCRDHLLRHSAHQVHPSHPFRLGHQIMTRLSGFHHPHSSSNYFSSFLSILSPSWRVVFSLPRPRLLALAPPKIQFASLLALVP
jgi:hypothetical protein